MCYRTLVIDIAAFSGIRFNPSKVNYTDVTSPPYDVISEAEREGYEKQSPFNVVRLILGPRSAKEHKYQAASALLNDWLASGILLRDPQPGLYVYEETIPADPLSGTHERKQVGVLAAVEISDEVLPHERTMAPVVEDRLEVIRTTRANLSPVFCLYWAQEDSASRCIDEVTHEEPYAAFESEDGLQHRAWRVSDSRRIETISRGLAGARVVIADGHHRYRTAQAYREERRSMDGAGPWDRMLIYLVNARKNAPALLPIHRLVSEISEDDAIKALAPGFSIAKASRDAGRLATEVASRREEGRPVFGFVGKANAWIATLEDEEGAAAATARADGGIHCEAWRKLDVSILHSFVFDRLMPGAKVTFAHHPFEVSEAVDNAAASLGVLLAGTPVDSVREIAEAGDSMPAKSTFFVPKPRTGIVIRPLW